jgi:hypothetical protein
MRTKYLLLSCSFFYDVSCGCLLVVWPEASKLLPEDRGASGTVRTYHKVRTACVCVRFDSTVNVFFMSDHYI